MVEDRLAYEIEYCRAKFDEKLNQILALQKANSLENTTTLDQKNEGFVTVSHSLELLKKMNDKCAHIIAKHGDKVVGYALAMTNTFRKEIPVLTPMFAQADNLYPNKKYIVMGQICVDKAYRKQGIFRGMYTYYKTALENDYDCLLTEVATSNEHSLNAHLHVGFKIIKTQVSDGVSWEIIYWDWK